MRGSVRLIEIIGVVLLLIVLAIVGSRVSADGNAADIGSANGNPPGDGTSNIVGLVDQLRLDGLTVTVEGDAREPELATTGQTLAVNGESIEVFAYPDIESADADASKIALIESDANVDVSDWIDTPFLFRSDRLLIIHVGGSPQLNSTLSDLFRAPSNTQNAH